MSTNPRPAVQAAAGDKPEKMPLGQALKKLFKFLAWFNIIPAAAMAVLGVFVVDFFANLGHYQGGGKIAMEILYLAVTFVISYFIVFVGEIVLGGGACVLFIAGNAIFGGHTTRAQATIRTSTTPRGNPNDKA